MWLKSVEPQNKHHHSDLRKQVNNSALLNSFSMEYSCFKTSMKFAIAFNFLNKPSDNLILAYMPL